MPELPEVETIARQLHQSLAGRTLGEFVHVARRDIIHSDAGPLNRILPGLRVLSVGRRAKRVVMCLSGPIQLVFHLGMSGRLLLSARDAPVEKHTHLRIGIKSTDRELRFCDPRRFGGVWCHANDTEGFGESPGKVGPEPLELTLRQFRRILCRARAIKGLLMDQRAIAGLGNIYCNEALHAAGLHPLARADTLAPSDADRLLRAIKGTLRRAIRFQGSTYRDYRGSNGEPGSFQKYHRVYQRDGQPCRTCGAVIRRILVAGRSTFLCPKCQANRSPTIAGLTPSGLKGRHQRP